MCEQWVAPKERAKAVSLTTSGMYLGSAAAMAVLPYLQVQGPSLSYNRTVPRHKQKQPLDDMSICCQVVVLGVPLQQQLKPCSVCKEKDWAHACCRLRRARP